MTTTSERRELQVSFSDDSRVVKEATTEDYSTHVCSGAEHRGWGSTNRTSTKRRSSSQPVCRIPAVQPPEGRRATVGEYGRTTMLDARWSASARLDRTPLMTCR